ncbi:MAG: Holliday junction resolvase RuvX [Micavibrio sp.]|nr:Holliday junction resolvase RuvX [Micavibrio sp.]
MSVALLKDIAENCPKNRALLGLDVGKKTIGLALSTPDQSLATPLHTVNRTKFTKDMHAILDVVKEFEVGGFILGYPVNMDGSEGPRAQSIRDFATEMNRFLKEQGMVEPFIAFWDERLSTVSVDSYVDKLVEKRKTKINAKSSGLVDKLAAQLILQGALGYLSTHQ